MKHLQRLNSSRKSPEKKSVFALRVDAVVRKIKRGKTLTYKQVATKAGNPNASRAVGMLMSKNFDPKIPCHRVIRSDGKMGGYNRGGAKRKAEILKKEALRE